MNHYTPSELVKIQCQAQLVANLANQMATMLIYTSGSNDSFTLDHQNGLQSAFDELHNTMLGSDFEIAKNAAQEVK